MYKKKCIKQIHQLFMYYYVPVGKQKNNKY